MLNDENYENSIKMVTLMQTRIPPSTATTTPPRPSPKPMSSKQKAIVDLLIISNFNLKKKRKKLLQAKNMENAELKNRKRNFDDEEQQPKTSQLERGKNIGKIIIGIGLETKTKMSENFNDNDEDDKNKNQEEEKDKDENENEEGNNQNNGNCNGNMRKRSICLICRKELLDDCCWHCRRLLMVQQANNKKQQEQRQQQQITRTRLILMQSECQFMTLRLAKTTQTQRTDYNSIKQNKYQQNINNKNYHTCKCGDNNEMKNYNCCLQNEKQNLQHQQQQQQPQLKRSSLILHCNCNEIFNINNNTTNNNSFKMFKINCDVLNYTSQFLFNQTNASTIATTTTTLLTQSNFEEVKEEKVDQQAFKAEEEDIDKNSLKSSSIRATARAATSQLMEMLTEISHQRIFYVFKNSLIQQNQLQQHKNQQNSKNHNQINSNENNTNNIYYHDNKKNNNQIVITNNLTIATTTTTTTKSANNKLENSLKNNNNNNSNNNNNKKNKKNSLAKIMLQQALRTFHLFTLFIHMQFLQQKQQQQNNSSNNKRQQLKQQQRLIKRLNYSHQQRTSYNGNNSNIFFTFYNLFISNNQRQQKQQQHRRITFSKTSQQLLLRQQQPHHSNVQSQQQQQEKHPNYHYNHHILRRRLHIHKFKMPNLSLLYKILIILSILSIFLPSTTHAHQPHFPASKSVAEPPSSSSSLTVSSNGLSSLKSSAPSAASTLSSSKSTSQQVRLSRNETVCKSLDLRNSPSEFSALQNCTVIEGFLVMTLVNTHTTVEFNESYPLLTEVTEFIIVYRVHNLRSLSQIFPNLSIIRGTILHEGYALVVYSNPHLEDLGLSKLTTIIRGGVRIENNLWLCYVDTIDWSLILQNSTDIVIQNNRAAIECPLCPDDPKTIRHDADGTVESDAVCREYRGKRHCWNSKMCQKICPKKCPNNCVDEKTCCNKACLSGCSPSDTDKCISCLHYSIHNSTCIDKCPPNYFSFADRRCITAEACLQIGTKFENNKQEKLVAFNKTCTTRCPTGFIKEDNRCVECGNSCTKKCEGGLIDNVSAARNLHGCTHIIKEGLTISIKRGGRHLMEDLEYGLSAIQVIDAYLKVHLTFGLFSLEFFKSLREIRGDTLCEEKFALYALENSDLEKLWNANQTVRIRKGRVFFHFNPKLCFSTIDELRPMMDNNHTFDKSEVAQDSNGSKGSCNTLPLNTTVLSILATSAHIKIVEPLEFDDERTFIGYQYFYMVDPYKNATKHRHRPCDDSWFVSEPTKETEFIITGLTPFTQYAYYIKTMTISSEPRNAQSEIQHFKTKSSQPNSVRKLDAYSNSSSEIVLQWLPPAHVYGKLKMYKVRAKLDMRNQKSLSRNYCKDPVKVNAVPPVLEPVPPPTEKPFDPDCKCYKDKTDPYEDESAEASRHDIIDFENALQNFIYVKHTNSSNAKRDNPNADDMNRRKRHSENDIESSFIMRHIRALPTKVPSEILSSTISSTTTTKTTGKILGNATTKVQIKTNTNGTTMDPTGRYYERYFSSVNATTTEFVFKKLKHFSIYLIEIEACREPEFGAKDKECSEVLSTYVRTLQMENVDKVKNLKATLDSNTSRTDVRLKWDPPERPNGAIVSYTILYTVDAKDSVEEKKCITDQDYQNMTNGYILTGLQGGANYSIKVRANSLAGEGVESEPIFVQTPKPGTMPLWGFIMLIIFGVLCIPAGAYGLYWWKQKKNVPPTDLRFYPSVNPYYHPIQYVPDNWEVARERVIQLCSLGQGSFGMVYEGILKGYNNSNEDTPCAIKTVNENATDRERLNFLTEAGVMKQFDTFHVVKLLGVCSRGQPALVVMELMKFGDLKSYLRKHRPEEREDGTTGLLDVVGSNVTRDNDIGQPPPLSRIYQMAIEIADGMAYLAAKKFVHRDLAARNCMVAADLTVKIGDFGMTRDIYETDYYRKGTKGLLPVRWMPPEALRDGVYSSASDVFSYGVVLWEMATLAAQPYQGLSNDQVLRYVIDGGVMERPENCPDKLYELMQKCWQHRPSARPSFMDIIGFLLDSADPKFNEVSFYASEEGQKVLNSERAELQHSGDVFHDPDHDVDDVTTPLRMGEYNEFQLNLDTNSSLENHGDSPPMVIEDHPHSPYSLGSANIVSSTPDDQLKHSFGGGNQQNPILSSAPSTSAGIIGGVIPAHTAHSYPRRYPSSSGAPMQPTTVEDSAAYVQPDEGFIEEAALRTRPWRTASQISRVGSASGGNTANKNTTNIPPSAITGPMTTGRPIETDERGYEVYDPSPKFREQSTYDQADDEEDFDGIGLSRGGKLSGGHNLLPRQKSNQRLPTVMPMSSSMPDEVISAPMSSSAASSNASSNATATAGSGFRSGAKYPTSLKRAVAETVQNVGNSLMPKSLRGIKPRFFSHKRTGSNASHKSTSSNPASSKSHTNLTAATTAGAGAGTTAGQSSLSGHNLGTIESGGSAGSYTATPRFFTPTNVSSSSTPPKTTTATKMSENPNYKLLDETANLSAISAAIASEANSTPTGKSGLTKSASGRPTTGFKSSNKDPQYQLLKESLNTTTSPIRTGTLDALSENPNYQPMEAPQPITTAAPANTSTNPYYVMNDPAPKISYNPNYQLMGPQQIQQQQQQQQQTTAVAVAQSPSQPSGLTKFFPPYGQRISSSDEEDPDDADDDDDAHTEHIKMERMPLSRRTPQKQQTDTKQKKRGNSRSRSRSKSRNKSVERSQALPTTVTTTTTATTPKTTAAAAAQPGEPTTFSLKEKWLRQQQSSQPPPNGFIGREG